MLTIYQKLSSLFSWLLLIADEEKELYLKESMVNGSLCYGNPFSYLKSLNLNTVV
jgi:hypothetical protein